jgi:hypothetical protein
VAILKQGLPGVPVRPPPVIFDERRGTMLATAGRWRNSSQGSSATLILFAAAACALAFSGGAAFGVRGRRGAASAEEPRQR